MAEIFALLLVGLAMTVVVPLAFPKREVGKNSIAAMKKTTKFNATGSATFETIPAAPAKQPEAKKKSVMPWQDLALGLVTMLQAGIAVGVLYFAYEVYQSTPTGAGEGGMSSLNFFAQFWLGAMFFAAVVAFSTGIFAFLKQRRQVIISAVIQMALGSLFLMLGSWAMPLTAALIIFALCSILVVRETTRTAPASRPTPSRTLRAVTTA